MSVVRLSHGGDDQIVSYECECDLAPGSLANVRAKFSRAGKKAALEEVIDELDTDVPGPKLYKGSWEKGEIEIVGLRRIVQTIYFMVIEYLVLFPPKKGGSTPVRGTYWVYRWNAGVENGVAVLPITADGRIVCVREFKHALRRWSVHVPRGLRIRTTEGILEPLVACGLREAGEESGVKTTTASRVIDLGCIYPDSGILMSVPRLLAVTNVEVDEALVRQDVTEAIGGTVVLGLPEFLSQLPIGGELAPGTEPTEAEKDSRLADAFTEAAVLRALAHGLFGNVLANLKV